MLKDGNYCVGMRKESKGLYEKYIKRLLDLLMSLLIFIILLPVLLVIAFLVRIKLGSPIIFSQERPGKINPKTGKEEIFKLYKFRTMTNEKDEKGNLLSDDIRLTRFGNMLRRTSLDELPELINIIKGDMSIIGPRPLLVKYLPYYTDIERQRHTIRPGLTGYAQVHGRNEISWEKKFELDVWYVNHLTFITDIKIVLDTIRVVFSHSGVSLNALEDFDEYRKRTIDTNN